TLTWSSSATTWAGCCGAPAGMTRAGASCPPASPRQAVTCAASPRPVPSATMPPSATRSATPSTSCSAPRRRPKPPPTTGARQYRADCLELQRRVDDLERKLGLRLQAFALLQKAHTATPADLTARLPAGTALVETVRYRPWTWGPAQKEGLGPPRYAAVLLWA